MSDELWFVVLWVKARKDSRMGLIGHIDKLKFVGY